MLARPRHFLAGGIAVVVAGALSMVSPSAQQMQAGANVNMAGGPASVTFSPTFKILGDPYLQRRNEPSIA